RVVNQWDCYPSNCGTGNYKTSLTYDAIGNPTQLTYPSTRTITYAYNNAARPTLVTLTAANGQTLNYPYVSNVAYAPTGSMGSLVLGNGLTESYTYNNRAELSTAKVSSSILTAMNHSYTFANAQGKDNGTLQSLSDLLNSGK